MDTSKQRRFATLVAALASLVVCVPSTEAQTGGDFGQIRKVAGDRQILVGQSFAAAPITVRAISVTGEPLPNRTVLITPTSIGPPCASLWDEFGSFGFNYGYIFYSCQLNGAIATLTTVDGLATINVPAVAPTPSSFLMGATIFLPNGTNVPDHARRQFFTIVRAVSTPAGNPSVVVEYFNEDVRHYFNTILQSEIDVLDRWQVPGWTRSVGGFIAWEKAADAPTGAVPVCRFFSARYTSHFYTADPFECDAVVARFAEDWLLETREAFYIYRPDPVTGVCIAGTMPVYRVFGGATRSPNHRYVTDESLRDVMVTQGWIAEGYGPNAVIMCTPR